MLVDCCNKYTTKIFFYCLSYFQGQNTVLLNIVTTLYIIYFIIGSLYLLNLFTPFIHLNPLPSGNHCSLYLWAWFFVFIIFLIKPLILYSSLNLNFEFKYEPINHVVTISGGQQRDSGIHVNVSILTQIPSHAGFHITLYRVPWAMQQVLVCYLF